MLTSGAYGYMADYLVWWLLLVSLLLHTWWFFKFFPWKRFRRIGLVTGNGLIFLCLAGIAAIGAESYLRFVAVETDAFGVSLPARRWFALNTKLNSLGCRDVEWTEKKPADIRRIAFVGDSITYGWGIEQVEGRFSDRIQTNFALYNPGAIEVMNVAKPGWDTQSQLEPIQHIISRYDVDEVVLCYVPNDIENLLPTTKDFRPTRPPEPTLFNPDSSCLLDYLYRRFYLPRIPAVRGYHDWLAEGFADQDIWRRHQKQLSAIIQVCRDQGVQLRVALLPFIRSSGEKYQANRLHAILRRFFEVNQTDVLDLFPTLEGIEPVELVVNSRDPHPNKRAHHLFAGAIWKAFYAVPGAPSIPSPSALDQFGD